MTNNATPTADLHKAFETKPCGRCGGSGQYSYCQMYGTRCFQCKGSGRVYTKRGQAALDYLRQIRTAKIADVQVGWVVWCNGSMGSKAGWSIVTEINPKSDSRYFDRESQDWKHYTDIETKLMSFGTFPDASILAVPSKERLVETKAEALRYQATLAETGALPV